MDVVYPALGRTVSITRLGVSPWSREAMGPDELERLEARCRALGVYVTTVKRRDRSWMVRVGSDNDHVVSLRGVGPVTAVIDGALDDWCEVYGEGWTVDEIVTVASQSGMEVRRA